MLASVAQHHVFLFIMIMGGALLWGSTVFLCNHSFISGSRENDKISYKQGRDA